MACIILTKNLNRIKSLTSQIYRNDVLSRYRPLMWESVLNESNKTIVAYNQGFPFSALSSRSSFEEYGPWIFTSNWLPCRCYHKTCFLSSQNKENYNKQSGEIVHSEEKPFSELTFGEKVTKAGKDATYTGIVIAGIVVTGLIFFAVGRELFSGESPSGIYGRAVKLCKKHEQVIDALGDPIKGYGEMNRRGRRQHVIHKEYEVGGVKRMRIQFYLEGPLNKGTVHLEVQQDDRGKYQFRYVYVQLDNYPKRTIVVEDNR